MKQVIKYDLEGRTAKFGEAVIIFCKSLKLDVVSKPIISQIIRSATSIGANYMEANGASSKKDFANKIFICKKESQETKYWLEILASQIEPQKHLTRLRKESQELVLIFQKITNSLDKNSVVTS